ncbi:MAG: GNAT family N-acetyltransferase [Alphaproteobacteria bacterium]|nr:GNAT family N-acetyltransferase [Alphaproteobacteria bacterium]
MFDYADHKIGGGTSECALTTETISSISALEALQAQWEDLWARSSSASPFQFPSWLLAWWSCLGGGELAVIAIWDRERLVGLVPLFIHTADGTRRLLPLGIGVTDYLDGLFDRACEPQAAAAAMQHLASASAQYDIVELHELRPVSPLLQARAPPGWRDDSTEESACPVLSLDADRDGRLRFLPKKTARDLRQAQNRCAAIGKVEIEAADAAASRSFFETLADLHALRWRRENEAGVLADAAVQRFHRMAVPGLAAAGLLRMFRLRLDGHPAAAYYGLVGKGRHYAYLTGFDPAFARQSVGVVLLGHAITQAMRENLVAFDMLRGREAYKYAWGGVDHLTYCRILRPSRA